MAKKPKKTTKRSVAPKTKIGIFGGTFDPIHFGHLNSIETVFKDFKLDEIWIVPSRKNPFREEVQKPTAEQRFEMVRIATSTLGVDVKFKVLSTELDRTGDSYTIDTLKELKKKNKDGDFYLVIGADQLEKFDQWRSYLQILKMASLVVTSRPDFNLPEEKALLPAWLRKEVKSFRSGKGLLKSGKHLHFLKLNDLNISATDIRRKIRRGEGTTHLTPTGVVEYIKQNKIYDPSDVLVSDYSEFTRFCAQVLSDKGGLEVHAYDLRNLIQPAEYTLVASGTSTRHAASLCEQVVQKAKEKYGIYPQSIEGLQEGRWVVVDYGALMIHVFYDYVRGEYRIEKLWAEAPKLMI